MCCGSQRAAARAAVVASSARAAAVPAPAASATSVIMFELFGPGPALIRGPVSGRVYRFAMPGDRVIVDARDRLGLIAMPALRWVR